ncbi:MAG: 7-cyano-7-deazaguanine synthase QueC [Alphaproteobacteria bacterium]
MPEKTEDATKRALVLHSGGQDSTVCLALALERFGYVETVGFHYGQRHGVELKCRDRVREAIRRQFPAWAERLGPDHMLDISSFGAIGDTALTSDAEIVMLDSGLPSSFVPGRNLAFFVYAAALGYRRGIYLLVGGMCETDYSGYPDCRDATLRTMEQALQLGTDAPFIIETPLMWRSKAETWAHAQDLGGDALVHIVIEETHTCYKGERGTRYDWGYGCGECPACELRAKGYWEWQDSAPSHRARST